MNTENAKRWGDVQFYSTRHFPVRHLSRVRTLAARIQIREGERSV